MDSNPPRGIRGKSGKFGWGFVAQTAVRSSGIVVFAPGIDGVPSFMDRIKPVVIQAFVSELAIKTLNKGILNRFSGVDKMKMDLMRVGPLIQLLARKF